MDNLRKQHVIVADRCCMWKQNEESVSHLLHCEVVGALWDVLFSRFWVCLGYASTSSRFICLLMDCRECSECYCVEDCAFK